MKLDLNGVRVAACLAITTAGVQAATIATYDFSGGEGSTPASVNGATFGAFTRGADLTTTAASGAFGSGGWTQRTLASTASSVSFVITPNPSAGAFTLEAVTFDFVRGNSGPREAEVRISYETTTLASSRFITGGSSTASPFTYDLSGSPVDTISPITVTFLGWDRANNSANTLTFDNVKIDGIAPVPEPVHYALGVFGLVFAGTRAGRRYLARRRAG